MESPPAVRETLDWIASELPEAIRYDSFARNYYKHCVNLTDGVKWAGSRRLQILDIGSGIGVFAASMARLGHVVVSMDIVTDNQPWIAAHGVETHSSDLLGGPLPFSDRSFDLVSMLDVIEHLHGSPRRPLQEILRVLRPAGHLIVETPNFANLRKRLALLTGHHPMNPKYFYESPYPYPGHVYEYTKAGLTQVIRWSGFEIVEFRYRNAVDRFHRTAKGFAPGIRIQGSRDLAMVAYLGICRLVPAFMDTMVCVGRAGGGERRRPPEGTASDR